MIKKLSHQYCSNDFTYIQLTKKFKRDHICYADLDTSVDEEHHKEDAPERHGLYRLGDGIVLRGDGRSSRLGARRTVARGQTDKGAADKTDHKEDRAERQKDGAEADKTGLGVGKAGHKGAGYRRENNAGQSESSCCQTGRQTPAVGHPFLYARYAGIVGKPGSEAAHDGICKVDKADVFVPEQARKPHAEGKQYYARNAAEARTLFVIDQPAEKTAEHKAHHHV